jgi:hypothetical protein
MNVGTGVLRKTIQEYNKCFYIRPEIFFNLEKEHGCGSISKYIIEDDEVINQEMKFEFIT